MRETYPNDTGAACESKKARIPELLEAQEKLINTLHGSITKLEDRLYKVSCESSNKSVEGNPCPCPEHPKGKTFMRILEEGNSGIIAANARIQEAMKLLEI
jgi:hypothetical protein